jgi:hypothetical protein
MRSRKSCSCASASGIAGGRNEAEDGCVRVATVRGEMDICVHWSLVGSLQEPPPPPPPPRLRRSVPFAPDNKWRGGAAAAASVLFGWLWLAIGPGRIHPHGGQSREGGHADAAPPLSSIFSTT